ncbi:MAG TPA: alpha/beta hydrolase [Geobacteraceae bacterium]|nr:alpha/beta hydrolase [Geobacteraceae bacterium]
MAARAFLNWVFVLAAALLLSGCIRPATSPMRTVSLTQSEPGGNRCLFVFLPGRRDGPESFAKEGFVEAVREAKLAVDMIGVDAHLGYYFKGIFPARLREDVIIPAKEKGYDQIWLVGISLGGLGALWYDGRYPGDVAGLVAIAPYLGEPETSREVSLAGGLTKWSPGHIAGNDFQKQIWRGLKLYTQREKNFARVYVGYGLQDEFAATNGVFCQVLPGDQVFKCEGGHDWDTWRLLWADILKELTVHEVNLRTDKNQRRQ